MIAYPRCTFRPMGYFRHTMLARNHPTSYYLQPTTAPKPQVNPWRPNIMRPFFPQKFSCTSDCIFVTKAPKLCEQIWNQLSNRKSKASVVTSVLVAFCSSVSTSRSLTASCGAYPKQMSDLLQCQVPILSNLFSSKTIGKANKKSTGKKT